MRSPPRTHSLKLHLTVGCTTRIKPEGDASPRICPRCHNISAISAKSRTWFEFCFVPLIPLNKRHLWVCGICQWSAPMQQGWEPQLAGPGYSSQQRGPGPMQGSFQPGYQPEYLPQSPPPATGKR
ncbi:hypothetical protein OF83DRAFT_1066096 [Amylostereum chailletii]|nr:hypothetical protein OF83DRAFT_1066096 [Amylostereum chailletii]